MKNLAQNSVLLILIFFVFISSPCFAQGKKDSLYVVEMDGKVLIPVNDQSNSYKIELLCSDVVIDSILFTDDESFLLKIRKNSRYMIRILKEGYYPVSISINTKLPIHNNDSYTFHFDVELVRINKIGPNIGALDSQPATISFNERTDAFAFHKILRKDQKN